MNKVVLDANIYVKLFKKEVDSQQAKDLVNKLVREGVCILAPSIVINETVTTCEIYKQDISEVCDFFLALIDSNIRFTETDSDVIRKTLDITKQGHEKSGFPTFSDSMYQAIAIKEDALFITADKRHYEKTKHLGNIELLGNLL